MLVQVQEESVQFVDDSHTYTLRAFPKLEKKINLKLGFLIESSRQQDQ